MPCATAEQARISTDRPERSSQSFSRRAGSARDAAACQPPPSRCAPSSSTPSATPRINIKNAVDQALPAVLLRRRAAGGARRGRAGAVHRQVLGCGHRSRHGLRLRHHPLALGAAPALRAAQRAAGGRVLLPPVRAAAGLQHDAALVPARHQPAPVHRLHDLRRARTWPGAPSCRATTTSARRSCRCGRCSASSAASSARRRRS